MRCLSLAKLEFEAADDMDLAPELELEELIPSCCLTPEQELLAKEIVEKILSQLSWPEQAVLVMHFIEEKNFQDIADYLGISRSEAQKICYGSIRRLRRYGRRGLLLQLAS